MKVLHVIASVDPRGGGPVDFIQTVSAEWAAAGHICHVATLDAESSPWLASTPLKTFAFGLSTRVSEPLRVKGFGLSLRFVRWLSKHASDYDAIIVHGLWNFASVGTWLALRRRRAPYFLFTHGMLDPWFNRAYPLKTVLKTLYWRMFETFAVRSACGVFFTTTEERELARGSFRPYSVRPFVVGLGTRDLGGDSDAQVDALRKTLPALAGRRFILFMSRIHPKKGLELLIRGFADVAAANEDLDLVIAGPDQVGLKADLQALAQSLGLGGRIHWPGMIAGDVKLGALQAAEFFALTSHQENFGIAVAEALAKGLPVLITDKVNTWREIDAAAAGVVVNDDVAGVTQGLRRMCRMDPDEKSVMRRNARLCFEQHYDLGTVATAIMAVMAAQRNTWTNDRAVMDQGLRASGV